MQSQFVKDVTEDFKNKNKTLSEKETVSFENFGLKALELMGWKQGKAIGRKPVTYSESIYEIKPRMQGLGLGAQAPTEEPKEDKKQISAINPNEPIINSLIYVIEGRHKGCSGIFKGMRGNTACIVEINGENIIVERNQVSTEAPNKNESRDTRIKIEVTEKKQSKSKALKWIQPCLIVRIISKKYYDGKYYLKKGTVMDLGSDTFYMMLPNGDFLEGLRERDVETTIPPIGGRVMIVKGEHTSHVGTIFRRDKSSPNVFVKETTTDQIIELAPDMCCALSVD